MTAEALPYGPETAAIRRFLVRLAGLGAADRRAIVQGWRRLTALPAYDRAETTLAQVIERSGREPARDALSGPLLQLVRAPSAPGGTTVPAASVNEASSRICYPARSTSTARSACSRPPTAGWKEPTASCVTMAHRSSH